MKLKNTYKKNNLTLFTLGLLASISFPMLSLAQAPVLSDTQAVQTVNVTPPSITPSSINSTTPEMQTLVVPNPNTGAPITMMVSTTINNPQTQTVPVQVPVNTSVNTPIHVQNQNTNTTPIIPVLNQNPVLSSAPICPPAPYGSRCAPSLERNIYLNETWDTLVPRHQTYLSDPAKSKPVPNVYTQRPLVRETPIALYGQRQNEAKKNMSEKERNAEVYRMQLQQMQLGAQTQHVTVYPVINRGDGVRALGVVSGYSGNSGSNNSSSRNTQNNSTSSQNTASTQNTTSPTNPATPTGQKSQDATTLKVASGTDIIINPGEHVTVWAEEAEQK